MSGLAGRHKIKLTACPHCGSTTVGTSTDGKTAFCWQSHHYENQAKS